MELLERILIAIFLILVMPFAILFSIVENFIKFIIGILGDLKYYLEQFID